MLRDLVAKARALPGPDNWVQAVFTIESLARTAREAGDWEFAGWLARQMVEHDPNYAGGQYVLGLVLEHDGNPQGARAAYRAALEKWPHADASLAEVARLRTLGLDRREP